MFSLNTVAKISSVTALVVSLTLLTGASVAAHGGSVPAKPTGLTAVGFHGGIALVHETVNPHVRLSWDDPGDTSITHYRILRRDVDTHKKGQLVVIDRDTGSAQTQCFDRSVEDNMRYVYRIVAVNEHGESRRSRSAEADTSLVPIVPLPRLDDTPTED